MTEHKELRTCVQCGTMFPKDGKRILCSEACKKKRHSLQSWESQKRAMNKDFEVPQRYLTRGLQ